MRFSTAVLLAATITLLAQAQESEILDTLPRLAPVSPPLDSDVHNSRGRNYPDISLPLPDEPFMEHVRGAASSADLRGLERTENSEPIEGIPAPTTPKVNQGGATWVGTADGLFQIEGSSVFRYATYGFDGPLSNVIGGLAVDSHDTLWVATPAGLSSRSASGEWAVIRGPQGLPWEELTCIAVDPMDRLWLGSTRGLIQYRPYEEGRQWFYRAGERYLPDDHVLEVVTSTDGKTVFARTEAGWSRIDEVERTLYSKAEYLEDRLQERHIRLGIPAPATYDDPYTMENWIHTHQASDGLWTSYHVAAMSMAYALTKEERYKEAAAEGMEALYLLQNVTGIEGLVARSVAEVGSPAAEQVKGADNWLPTDDGKYIWRDDVSSDQIDGHYFAFYTYYEHIAQHDPAEKARIQKQIRQVTDYILDNNYQIPDWDGERTLWGWWNPELLNDAPVHYLESGLYSLMMLSFLKVTHYITDDEKYMVHYKDLIENHGYLSNLLLEKKLFPDELNHSDDQLSAVAFYPIMQLEHDPFIRSALHRAIRRHARIEVPERNSLFVMVYASVDPNDAEVLGGLQTLREMPQDRRDWKMDNSHRADVVVQPYESRQEVAILRDVLPADERDFERWNADPYRADSGGSGQNEGSGEHYILPYWLARFHGVLAAPAN